MSAPRVLVAGAVLSQGPGGVRRHNQELLPRAQRLLQARGGGLTVLAGRDGVAFPLPPRVEVLASRVPGGPPAARWLREARALRAALAAARAAGRPFDLVHTGHLPHPADLDVPLVLTLHDLRATDRYAGPLRRLLAGRVLAAAARAATTLIAVSESVAGELRRRFDSPRVRVVPNAGDHLGVLPRAPGPDAALLHVGHLEPRKNLGLLLEALALDPGLPPLELAGAAKGREEQRLRAAARALGVAERVRFLGPVEDSELPALYARCAAVVVPSRLEGFGIGVLEAQRAMAPLAISSAGALPEVAGAGVPTFAPHDARECAAAIRAALASDGATLAEHAQGARRFSWDASAEALVAAWSEAARRERV